ncbi:receptor-like protein 19 [Cryptomeria japonica]|uniref:receptor-like protein 19 n=1 Tax=Cryptomeria japonica TaxID=3369 RepID=UPI0027DA1063|nr:receptor-like protein 19 [Cryptomeria japonica]
MAWVQSSTQSRNSGPAHRAEILGRSRRVKEMGKHGGSTAILRSLFLAFFFPRTYRKTKKSIANLNANGNGTNGNGWWQREWAHTCHTKRSTLSVCCLRVAVSFLQSLNWSLPSRVTLPKYFGYLDLHNNSLKGARPLPLAGAYLLDLSMNQFNGSIPSHIGAYLENARFLSLSRNNLSGAIPDSICTPYLEVLDLSKNTLSSVIPPHLTRNSSSLSVLDLAENHLEGKLPAEWGNITKIHTLKLNGPIPRNLTNLLAMVNASQSNPDYLEEYTSIGATYTNQIKISWKGWDVEFVKVLFILKCIDLSNNLLSGSIPPEMGSLQGLIALNLSRNHLSGRIPKTLGRMDQLESWPNPKNIGTHGSARVFGPLAKQAEW